MKSDHNIKSNELIRNKDKIYTYATTKCIERALEPSTILNKNEKIQMGRKAKYNNNGEIAVETANKRNIIYPNQHRFQKNHS